MPFETITILGLGPAGAEKLTREAWDLLSSMDLLYLRTAFLPVLAGLPDGLKIKSFDDLFDEESDPEEGIAALVEKLIQEAKSGKRVVYGVPGSPYIAEQSVSDLVRAARQEGIPVRIIDGMSFLEPVCAALGIDPSPALVLLDAGAVAKLNVPPYSPSQSALITNISSKRLASELKLTLMAAYPDEYPVLYAHGAGTDSQIIEDLALWEIDQSPYLGALSTLYLPAREHGRGFEDLQEVVARLRAPDGCPWDKEQTHQSLRPYIIEEAYEVLDALDQEDAEHIEEELGDLLLQVVLHSQIATEDEDFKMTDVIYGIASKLIRRHPHVFAEVNASNAEEVTKNWEEIKAAERKAKGVEKLTGMLDGIPKALPALIQADQIQERAKRVGFDWESFEPVVAKVHEELNELLAAKTNHEKQSESGDLLFACVNVIRWLKVDPEMALRETNGRFRQRFAYIEAKAVESGRTLQDLSFEEMDHLWDEAKLALRSEANNE